MTEIASHRGGALLWPENSRIAFENTARLPVDQVEFDVHPSRDGKLVVIHDATLERTTDGTGPVAARDWTELSALILKGAAGQRMLLLDEVIEIFRSTAIALRVELKAGPDRQPYPRLPGQVVAALAAAGMLDRSILTSFQLDTVRAAGAAGTPRNRVWLVAPDVQIDIGIDRAIELARASGIPTLGIRQSHLDASIVAGARAAGLGIGGWACNDGEAIGRMFDLGVDVFTTDRPDLAVAHRQRRLAR